jgi:hypothetical protein
MMMVGSHSMPRRENEGEKKWNGNIELIPVVYRAMDCDQKIF